jgi:hypothetical protein
LRLSQKRGDTRWLEEAPTNFYNAASGSLFPRSNQSSSK